MDLNLNTKSLNGCEGLTGCHHETEMLAKIIEELTDERLPYVMKQIAGPVITDNCDRKLKLEVIDLDSPIIADVHVEITGHGAQFHANEYYQTGQYKEPATRTGKRI